MSMSLHIVPNNFKYYSWLFHINSDGLLWSLKVLVCSPTAFLRILWSLSELFTMPYAENSPPWQPTWSSLHDEYVENYAQRNPTPAQTTPLSISWYNNRLSTVKVVGSLWHTRATTPLCKYHSAHGRDSLVLQSRGWASIDIRRWWRWFGTDIASWMLIRIWKRLGSALQFTVRVSNKLFLIEHEVYAPSSNDINVWPYYKGDWNNICMSFKPSQPL